MTKPDLTEQERFFVRAQARALAELVIPAAREAAMAHGYALAVHGSLSRDIDLVAIPWSIAAIPAVDMKDRICEAMAAVSPTRECAPHPHENDKYHQLGCPDSKPHGRRTWTFYFGINGYVYVDLSIMPRTDPPYPDEPFIIQDDGP